MTSFFHWIVFAVAIAVMGLGGFAFFRGLSLPPNGPDHRANAKDETWRIR